MNNRMNELFGDIFYGFRQEMPNYSGWQFFEINKVKVYINKEATYVTVEIGKDKWLFGYNDKIVIYDESSEIDDRIEMLLLDAFEKSYETMYNSNHKEKLEQESLIDNLFKKFVKRRKLETPNKAILNIKKPNKIYI